MELALENNLTKNLDNDQNSFLNNNLWNSVSNGVDIALRAILPDFAENVVIEFKDNLFEYGFFEGVSKTFESVINKGKSALGIVTGDFESVGQINDVIKKGGIIDSISGILDAVLNKLEDLGVNGTIINLVKSGKDAVLDSIESNLNSTLEKQITSAENLEKYMEAWKNAYNNKDFDNMERQFKKMEKELSVLVPIEKTINAARSIENLHNLIKNNGQNFDISDEEMELLDKLCL